ncbi:MAG: hypothetical protein AAFP04_10840 [Myxococcota bacterium]
MKRLNRCVLVIRPLPPYLEWASAVSDDDFLDEEDAEALASAYLLPDLEDEEQAEALLAEHATALFESELSQWSEDPARWPEQRDMDMLLQWFAIDMIPLVVDLGRDTLKSLPVEYD